ncbi:MAG: methyl-accepting chemotaxis protein [Bacillota bacterium]
MQIRDRILACLAGALALVLLAAALAAWQINQINGLYRKILEQRVAAVNEAQKMLAAYEYMTLMMRTYLLTGDPEYKKEYEVQAAKLDANVTGLGRLVQGTQDRAAFEKLIDQFCSFRENYAEPIITIWAREDLNERQKKDLVAQITLQRKGTVRGLIKATEDFILLEERLLREEAGICGTRARQTALAVILGGTAAVLLGAGGAVFVARRITAPLLRLERDVVRIASGDLTLSELAPRGEDEIGRLAQSFNLMLAGLRETASLLRQQARDMEEARVELRSQAELLAEGLLQTAGRAEALGSAVERLRAFYRERVADGVGELTAVGTRTEQALQRLGETAVNSWQSATRAAERLHELDRCVAGITRVVEVINYIGVRVQALAQEGALRPAADQELKTLAEQVKTALGDVTGLATSLRLHTEELIANVRENIDGIEEQQRAVTEATETLQAVLDGVRDLALETSRTEALAQDISAPAEKVLDAAKNQAALLEKVVVTAERLRTMADRVHQIVGRFKLPGDGGNETPGGGAGG